MSWPSVTGPDGYETAIGSAKSGNDIREMTDNPSIVDCKAACNSTDICKSIAYSKDGSKCYLKSWTKSDSSDPNSSYDTYFKTGDTGVKYRTKPGVINGNSGSRGWTTIENSIRYDWGSCNIAGSRFLNVNSCPSGYSELSGSEIEDASRCLRKRLCGNVPLGSLVCPDIGNSSDDIRYMKHDNIGNDLNYSNGWNAAARDPPFYKGFGITCGYNRIRKDKWPELDTWFDGSTKSKIIKEYCEGPGISSRDLAADSSYCGNSSYFSNSEYNQAILNKLKTEANWWVNATNCANLESVIIASTNDQSVMRVAGELIDSLPSTGWSDELVRALNSMKGNGNVPLSVKSKIDPKITAYCSASDENENEKCACRNAAVRGKAKTCQSDIVGCADVKRYTDLIDKAKKVNQVFGTQMETIYDPNSQSDACQNTKLPTSTILRYGNVGDSKLDVAACFTEFENSGEIGGDVSLKCDIAVKNYESMQTASGGDSSSSSSGGTNDGEKILVSGDTAGIKNDYWLIGLCLCCLCFLIIGVVLAAVLI